MKSLTNIFLVLTAGVLLFVNWQVWTGPKASTVVPPPANTPAPASAEPAQAGAEAEHSTAAATTNVATAEGAEQAGGSSTNARPFDWTSIEVGDYKEYVKRLKAVGFPDDLVRDIIIADVDKLYEAREQALKRAVIPYDAPMAQRQTHDISAQDWQNIKDLRDLRVEKQTLLENVLGEYVPREILRTPISRNYESYEYAIAQLPAEKRQAAQAAQETEILEEGYNKTTIQDHDAELESFKRTRTERDDALRKVLTPEEFDRYEMNTTPAGTELARRTIGMQPTDQEFQAMFKIAYKNWADTGGVYGRWRALPVPREQIVAADAEMNSSMETALGADRFLDYRMAINEIGQQMRNFAARFEVPRETMAEAFDLQTQMDQLTRRPVVATSPESSTGATLAAQAEEIQSKMQQLLGPDLYLAWNSGRRLKVSLDP